MFIGYLTGRYLVLIVVFILGISTLSTYAITNHTAVNGENGDANFDNSSNQTQRRFDRPIFKKIVSYYAICLVFLYIWKLFCPTQEFGNAWFYGIMWRLPFDMLGILIAFNLIRETPSVCSSYWFSCVIDWGILQFLAGIGLTSQIIGSFVGLSVGSKMKETS